MRAKRNTPKDGFKRCPRCEQTLPLTAFGDSYCRPCRAAYQRVKSKELYGRPDPTLGDRLFAQVDKAGPGGCWLWLGYRTNDGHGCMYSSGRKQPVHRLVFEAMGLPGPAAGEHVDHLCRVRACCNPQHLRFVTPAQNALENNSSPFAQNKAKRWCKWGHPLEGDNVRMTKYEARNKRGEKTGIWRECRQCAVCYATYKARMKAMRAAA